MLRGVELRLHRLHFALRLMRTSSTIFFMNQVAFISKIVAVYILIFTFSASASSEQTVEKLTELKIKLISEVGDISSWKFQEQAGYFKNDSNEILRLTQFEFEAKAAEKFIENQMVQMRLLFAPMKAAYIGMVSKEETCKNIPSIPKKLTRNKSGALFYAEIPATAEGQYGSCGVREEPYLSQRLIVYCRKEKTLYDIHYLRPAKDGAKYFNKPIANCLK